MRRRNWWNTHSRSNAWHIAGILLLTTLAGIAQEIPIVADVAGLEGLVGETWTNNSTAKMFPPQTDFELNIGGIAFEDTFETGLVANLVPVTNETVVLYPMWVIETNQPSRQRTYYNADAVAVHTTTNNPILKGSNFPD